MEPDMCDECGAATTPTTCAELFDQLLALDHSRRQPWGALHGEAVASYFAQHPNAVRAPRDVAPLLHRLAQFVDKEQPLQPRVTTIQDVAVDGTFPASGYRERLERWARSILATRADRRDHP